jgi:hypothetical protein
MVQAPLIGAAGIEHVVDLGAVLGPFFDLVEVAMVRD